MTLKTGALLAMLGIGVIGLFVLAPMPEFLKPTAKPIIAHVLLLNNCPVRDSAFTVQDVTTGKTTPFSGKSARVKTVSTHQLTLSLAKKYNDVVFSGTPARAKENMTLTADCQTSEKENATFQSLRKTLGGQ